MKNRLMFLLTLFAWVLSSWTNSNSGLLNTNSWSLSIGEKVLLASWKNHELGATVTVARTTIKLMDTLYVERYLCGQNGNESISILTIKDALGDTIAEFSHKNTNFHFSANAQLADIVKSPKYSDGMMMDLYFTIKASSMDRDETVLLARLQIK